MIVEIRGAAFKNKGAELMLNAIISKLRENYPNAILVMEPNNNEAPYIKRAQHGLFQKLSLDIPFISKFPTNKLRKYGIIHYTEIDFILDASGYMYGDVVTDLSDIDKYYKKIKENGGKIILLPQAFGPFNDKTVRKSFINISENVDKIYARDNISYDYVLNIVGDKDIVRRAPDFTNLIEGVSADQFDSNLNQFCIIPNYRMIDKTQKGKSEYYLKFLISITKYLISKKANPFFLIHEGDQDHWIAKEVIKELKTNVNIIKENNPLKIKNIIGQSKGVISSRYHGLISALSQSVPAYGTSWSHKYEMLFKDYNFEEGVLDVTKQDLAFKKIDLLINERSRNEIAERLRLASKGIKIEASAMWDEVFSLMDDHLK